MIHDKAMYHVYIISHTIPVVIIATSLSSTLAVCGSDHVSTIESTCHANVIVVMQELISRLDTGSSINPRPHCAHHIIYGERSNQVL